MNNCIFCKIIRGEIPSSKVYENEKVLGFKDINPAAPTHILIVPKSHIDSIDSIDETNCHVLSEIFLAIKTVAAEQGLTDGYRVVSNVGAAAGQTVEHLHFHILGGRKLSLTMC